MMLVGLRLTFARKVGGQFKCFENLDAPFCWNMYFDEQ